MSEDAGPFDVPHEPCSEFAAICDGRPHAVVEGIKTIDEQIEAQRTLSFIIDYLVMYSLSEQNTIGELMYRLRKEAG